MRRLPEDQRDRLLRQLNPSELAHLEYLWLFWARVEQLPPEGRWRFWLLNGGRGAGKTRAGSEWVRRGLETGLYQRVALVGPTMDAVRHVMVEGPSGLLAVCPPWCRPVFEPSRHLLRWPQGGVALLYSADAPERLRGPQHDAFWADEFCAWREASYAWDMLLLGARLGNNPRGVITTTPKPLPVYRALLNDPTVHVATSSTLRNASNLAPAFLSEIITRYDGTRLGRQELHAELLDDVDGALWERAWIERSRVDAAPPLAHVVVAVDPSVSSRPGAHEAGIVVAGVDARGDVFVVADQSLRGSPNQWARRAIDAWRRFQADELVVEGNQGGELVTWTLQTVEPTAPVQLVTASKGKRTRAEPVAALYEQGRVHHVGRFPELEDQLCLWDATAGGLSPDRLDALVWAVSALAVVGGPPLALINSDVGPSSITSRGSFDLIWGALRRRS